MKQIWPLAIFLCSIGVSPLCNAQVGEIQARIIAEETTRRSLDLPESQPLRVHRREDLEDDLFYHQRKVIGKIAKAAYFFEVSETGEFVISPDRVMSVTVSHGESKMLVAVSAKNGQPYRLFGFKNAGAAFNDLAKDAFLLVDSVTSARLFSYFYFSVVKDLGGKLLIFQPRQLRHEVEDYFYLRYPETKAESLYKAWWRGYSSNKKDIEYGADAQTDSQGYSVSLTYLRGARNTPQLELLIFHVSPEGLIQVNEIQTVYPK